MLMPFEWLKMFMLVHYATEIQTLSDSGGCAITVAVYLSTKGLNPMDSLAEL